MSAKALNEMAPCKRHNATDSSSVRQSMTCVELTDRFAKSIVARRIACLELCTSEHHSRRVLDSACTGQQLALALTNNMHFVDQVLHQPTWPPINSIMGASERTSNNVGVLCAKFQPDFESAAGQHQRSTLRWVGVRCLSCAGAASLSCPGTSAFLTLGDGTHVE